MKMKKKKRLWVRILLGILYTVLIAMIIIGGINLYIYLSNRDKVYHTITTIPTNQYGLLLGTSKYTMTGERSGHFFNRIRAAKRLLDCGKIRMLVVSGATDGKYYNESREMRKALNSLGVADSLLILDPEGNRTIDSLLRMKHFYHITRFTVISQEYHDFRALFLADALGLNAIAYSVDDFNLIDLPRTLMREIFARVKAVLDIYILDYPQNNQVNLRS